MQQQTMIQRLEQRLGREQAQRRLDLETEHEQIFGKGINFFHPENWYSTHSLIRFAIKLTGLYGRGYRNTELLQVRHNDVQISDLPRAFEGFTILHVSDMHADMNPAPMDRLSAVLGEITYDVCVLTGDFRGQTFGPYEPALESLGKLRQHLHDPIYAVLGNHDTIRMVPRIEGMGIRLLLNESLAIVRGDERIHLAGVDDAHYYRADDISMATASIPKGDISILLSHTPEIYRKAAEAGFQLMLSGHTHGGQICLPGSIPLTLDAVLPRRMGAGAWIYESMAGYTSVGVGSSIVPVRFNCLPEITLHHLRGRVGI